MFRAASCTDQGVGSTCKILGVAGNVEANNVAAEQTFEDLLPPGKNREDVVSRKGCVVEKGDLQIRTFLSDVPRGQPQVVIVDPDGGSWGSLVARGLSEASVDIFEDSPVSVVDIEIGGKRVKNRPETLL